MKSDLKRTLKQRQSQRGSVLLIAMGMLIGLLSVGLLTLSGVRRGSVSAKHERFHSVALFAAESGLSAGMAYMRTRSSDWATFASANNSTPYVPDDLPGNGVSYEDANSTFSGELNLWYEVTILNNEDDPNFAVGESDGIMTIRSVGHGPDGATVVLEMDVDAAGFDPVQINCDVIPQGNINALGSGNVICGDVEDTSGTGTYTGTSYTPGS